MILLDWDIWQSGWGIERLGSDWTSGVEGLRGQLLSLRRLNNRSWIRGSVRFGQNFSGCNSQGSILNCDGGLRGRGAEGLAREYELGLGMGIGGGYRYRG